MTLTQPKLTFTEYLTYDDDTDNRYELEEGELILMNPPIGLHAFIIRYLNFNLDTEIKRLNLDWITIQNIGFRTAMRRVRIPDLCVVTREQFQPYLKTSAILETPPLLSVEIVSPESRKRDYRYKRSEYSVLEVPEYWIIDPLEQKIMILNLVEGWYEETEYRGNEKLISTIFPELVITVNCILQGEL